MTEVYNLEIINQILGTYALFFDWEMWGEVLTDPVAWGSNRIISSY